jgi:hypothetical protein
LHECHDFLDLRGLKQAPDSLGVKIGESPRIDMDDFKKALEEVKERINAGHGIGG